MVISGLIQAYVIIQSLMDLNFHLAVINLIILLIAVVYGFVQNEDSDDHRDRLRVKRDRKIKIIISNERRRNYENCEGSVIPDRVTTVPA